MKKPARRIPGSLDTSAHSDFGRTNGMSGEQYMTDMDRVKYQRLVALGQITIFRMLKCQEAGCEETVPSGSGKLWCSQRCRDLALSRMTQT